MFNWFGLLLVLVISTITLIVNHEIELALIFGILTLFHSIATVIIIRKAPEFFRNYDQRNKETGVSSDRPVQLEPPTTAIIEEIEAGSAECDESIKSMLFAQEQAHLTPILINGSNQVFFSRAVNNQGGILKDGGDGMFLADELPPGSKGVITIIKESVILFCVLLALYWFLLTTSAGYSITVDFMSWLCQEPYTRPFPLPALNIKSIILLAAFCPLYIWYWHNRL